LHSEPPTSTLLLLNKSIAQWPSLVAPTHAQALLTGQITVALPPSAVLHVGSPDDHPIKNFFVMDVPGGSLIQLPTVPNKCSTDGYTIP